MNKNEQYFMETAPPTSDTIWVAERWYDRHDGSMEHVEVVLEHESLIKFYTDSEYRVTKYVKAD